MTLHPTLSPLASWGVRLGLLCAVSVASSALAEGPYTLRMKWVQGEKRRYEMHQTMEMQSGMSLPGMNGPMRMHGEMGIEVLQALPDGSAKLRIVRSAMTMDPPNPMLAGRLSGIVAEATSSARGELKVLASKTLPAPLLKALEQALRSFGGVLPDKPVNVGDTWTVPVDAELPAGAFGASGPGSLRGDAQMTLRAVETRDGRRCAMIPVKATMKVDVSTNKPEVNALSGGGVHIDASGHGTGESCFDLDKNDFVTTTMSFELTMAFGGGPQNPMQMQIKALSKMEYKRLADGPVSVEGAKPPAPTAADPAPMPTPMPVPMPSPMPTPAPAPAP